MPLYHKTTYSENTRPHSNFVDHKKDQPPNIHGWHKTICKNEKELGTLIHTVRLYSQYIRMKFGIEKCALLVMKSGKRHLTDGIELPNQVKIRPLAENETYIYLGILEADTIKQVEMKNKIQKEYLGRTRKLLETKLSSRNLIKGINTWAVAIVRYSGPFPKWTRDELRQMDQRTIKLMTMHKALHPRDDVDRIYVPRKEGGRELSSIEYNVDASILRLEDYIEKHERGLITAIRNNTDNTIDNRIQQLGNKNGKENNCMDFLNNISHETTWIKPKECEKRDKYLDLAREEKKIWNMKVTIIPIVTGAFDTVTKGLLKGLEDLEVGGRVETIQTTVLLKTARILRRVLETWGDLLLLNLK